MDVGIKKVETKVILTMTVGQAMRLADAIERDAEAQNNWSIGNYAQTIRAALKEAKELA